MFRFITDDELNYGIKNDGLGFCLSTDSLSVKPVYNSDNEYVKWWQFFDNYIENNKFKEYIDFCYSSVAYPECYDFFFMYHGLYDEMGESSGILKRIIRNDFGSDFCNSPEFKNRLIKELGDVLWHLCVIHKHRKTLGLHIKSDIDRSMMCNDMIRLGLKLNSMNVLYMDNPNYSPNRSICIIETIAKLIGSSLEEVMEENIKKCKHRAKNNTILGEGDDR